MTLAKAMTWKLFKSILKKIDNYPLEKERRKRKTRKVKKSKKKKNKAGKTKRARISLNSIVSRHARSLRHRSPLYTGSKRTFSTKRR